MVIARQNQGDVEKSETKSEEGRHSKDNSQLQTANYRLYQLPTGKVRVPGAASDLSTHAEY